MKLVQPHSIVIVNPRLKVLVCLLWLFSVVFLKVVCGDVITMGYITGSQRRPGDQKYHRPGLTISGAISLAVDEINRDHRLIGNHTLDFVVAETYGEENESILQTALLWRKNVSVYIGPQETCVHEAKMAASFNLPMISYYCIHRDTSSKDDFPTFARTRPPDTQISKSVASVLKSFSWNKIAFLYTTTARYSVVARTILAVLEACGVEVRYVGTWSETYHYGFGENPFVKLIDESYLNARIYVVLGSYYEHIGLVASLEAKGLFKNGEYFVVGVDIEKYDMEHSKRYFTGLLNDEVDEASKRAFQSYIGTMASPAVKYDEFTAQVNKHMTLPPFNTVNVARNISGYVEISSEAAYLYDAVYIYARAVNECLKDGMDYNNGRLIFQLIKGRTYRSVMGFTFYMDDMGDAEGNYTLIARKRVEGTPNEFGMYPVGVFQLPENSSDLPVLYLLEEIDWAGDGPPADEPSCGFQNEKCILWKVASGIAGGLILLFLIVLLVIYRYWAYEQELDSLLWKIDYKDIQINEFTPTSKTPRMCQTLHPMMRTSQVSLSSNPEADFRYSTIYAQVGLYRGQIYAIRKFKKKSIDITRRMKKELKAMKDLRYDNINPFIGACIDPPNICIITEYCSRGSLKDILENDDVKLDNMFVASLVGDIVRGMIYLHDSSIRSHGNLKSSNCLVDSRWVVKLADFGLHELKCGAEVSEDNTDFENQCERLIWRAPELLRDPNAPSCGTQKGDVYSFAIILYEITGRHGPYGRIGMTPSEIVKRVMWKDKDAKPFRPQLEFLENSFDCIKECMADCWQEDPDCRPDFKTIRARLRPMRKGMKPNIFDNMLAMMEKYATNLEALVDERTDLLVEEKKKTEALLYEMLPKYVADQLKRGKKVEAESFDSVTIYFSDIVGFTTMSADSSPLEVVDFLNDLYTCFDSIIEHYDVYKVETIGDAYMVVSGLPIRNGLVHAGEIASMALHLLEAVRKFKIRHKPKDTLMLRIGIHSGPVCAGVVGLKMPRYCLFGDTVNTASRMESTGSALKIHCSAACRDLLLKLGGYLLEDRGLISIKGKGEMRTFWVLGEEESRRRIRQNKLTARLNEERARSAKSSFRKQSRKADHSPLFPLSSSRRASLEYQKKLRFAPSQENLLSPASAANAGSLPEVNQSPKVQDQKGSSCPSLNGFRGDVAMFSSAKLAELINRLDLSFMNPSKKVKNNYPVDGKCLSNCMVDNGMMCHSESEPFIPKLEMTGVDVLVKKV